MKFENEKLETDTTELYWKYKEMKGFYKLVNKSQNKYIPVEKRKRIFQTISDLMIYSLPDEVDILDLFPCTDFGYSKKGKGVKNVWTFKEVNEYMDDLVREKNGGVSNRNSKRNRFFKRELDRDYEKNEKEECRAYTVLLKICRQSCFEKEKKEYFCNELKNIVQGTEEEKA